MRFDERVAIVTGAGRGIGAAYARLLAARGAHVVVNDLGGSIEGDGADSGPAASVVASIVADGGSALADTNDIAVADGAAALVGAAIERFGRIDIVVNNAGIMRWARMPDIDPADFEKHLAVHLAGTFHVVRAAWPHMAAAGYGRIVNTASAGVFGLPNNTSYAAAKGGIIGLSRSLAHAGRKAGIKVNVIAPAAVTRMAKTSAEGDIDDSRMAPELVAPMVAYLAHEECPVSGEIYAAGAGRFSRVFIASTPGYLHAGAADDAVPTIEDVAANWAQVNDEAGYTVPSGLLDWSAVFTQHLAPDSTQDRPAGG